MMSLDFCLMKNQNTQSARFTNTGFTNVTTAHSNWTCVDPLLCKVVHIKHGVLNGIPTVTFRRLVWKHGSEHIRKGNSWSSWICEMNWYSCWRNSITLIYKPSQSGYCAVALFIVGSSPTNACSCRLGCHVGHQEACSCHTKGTSEESIARRWQSTQVRDPTWLWNPGQTSLKVQNRDISGPTKYFKISV